jgi:glycosyltransferase involved in cell wall biosynthesis
VKIVQRRYQLPDRYILTLTKRKGGGRKNLGQIFKAYALYHQSVTDPCPLVIGGKDCHLFREEYQIPENGYGQDIHFPGWIDQQDLPAVYTAAELFLYPSNVEAFPIPITEAMVCGTPILTSNVNGLVEIAGDAARFVDPQDLSDIAEGIRQMLEDPALRESYAARGLARSSLFTWEKCASETLAALEEVYRGRQN